MNPQLTAIVLVYKGLLVDLTEDRGIEATIIYATPELCDELCEQLPLGARQLREPIECSPMLLCDNGDKALRAQGPEAISARIAVAHYEHGECTNNEARGGSVTISQYLLRLPRRT